MRADGLRSYTLYVYVQCVKTCWRFLQYERIVCTDVDRTLPENLCYAVHATYVHSMRVLCELRDRSAERFRAVCLGMYEHAFGVA